ncbi:MAG TPA: S9 family peptidase [Thermoanaerobaculia bacterium]|nr:S9 family peptidase [Thermoanaerobaculia bacterium]
MRKILLLSFLSLLALPLAAAEPRLLKVEDIHALKTAQDPQVSPDGRWVAYVVRSDDLKEDRQDTDLWMVPFAGGEAVQLTASPKGESRPRWSPDNRWLAFLSDREGEETQAWLLDRRGGEATKLTDYPGGVSDLAWSPDGKRLVLEVTDPDPDDAAVQGETKDKDKEKKEKKPKPIVIHRLQFKQDTEYLDDRRTHLYVFDLESRKGVQVTSGPFDDTNPVWSPDGRTIAFVSKRAGADPDAADNSDVFVVAPEAGSTPRALTTWEGADRSPAFSPDGQWIVYVAGGDPKDVWYDTSSVAVVPVAGGPARLLTRETDRNVSNPLFTPDGRSILFLLEDGGNVHLARVPAAGGPVERVVTGEREIEEISLGSKGETAVLEARSTYPPEVSAVDGSGLRRLSHVNDEFLRGIKLAETRRSKAKSADGTPVDAYLTLPPDLPAGKRAPAILRIHGGPVSQFSTGWQLEWQILAAHGYAVITANPRGSSGYGHAFSRAIWADWGNKDFEDVMAAVDGAVAQGVADPERLGVGGWSYGGILTNYVMVKSQRFKAGISGASETNYLANYGTDHYQKEWEGELGLPWQNTELWLRLSPFFQVEKIRTPMLLLCSGNDVNVPCLNSEQLYQALRRLGRTTELVIYPGQGHSLNRPSFLEDRFERYLAWYDKYLQPAAATTVAGAGR